MKINHYRLCNFHISISIIVVSIVDAYSMADGLPTTDQLWLQNNIHKTYTGYFLFYISDV